MDRESIQELHNAVRKVEKSLFDSRDILHLAALNTAYLDGNEQEQLDSTFDAMNAAYGRATALAEHLAMLLRKRSPFPTDHNGARQQRINRFIPDRA